MGFGFTETNVTINMGQQAAASLENRPVKERPIWMTESTVEGGKQDSSFSVSNSTYFLEIRGLATYASSVSFGHTEHYFFDSLDTQKFRSEFADDHYS